MALNPQHEQMNQALDERLTGAALAEFQAFLEAHPEEAASYEALQQIDRMLRQPPMAAAPEGFAAAVMAQIAAGKHEAYALPERMEILPVAGLALGTAVVLPLLVVLILLAQTLFESGALFALLHGLVQVAGSVSAVLVRALAFLGGLVTAYPMAPALMLTVIPMMMLWGWLVWFLRQRTQPMATVVIKVQAV